MAKTFSCAKIFEELTQIVICKLFLTRKYLKFVIWERDNQSIFYFISKFHLMGWFTKTPLGNEITLNLTILTLKKKILKKQFS